MIKNHSLNICKVKNIDKRRINLNQIIIVSIFKVRSIKRILIKVNNKSNRSHQNLMIGFLNKFKGIGLIITARNNMYIMFLKSKEVNKRKNNQKMEK